MSDSFLGFTITGAAVVLILCGLYIAKPNLHGSKFERGHCQITSVGRGLFHEEDVQKCDCGKSCTGTYPCVTVQGGFSVGAENSIEVMNGTFYADFNSLTAECLYIPDKCVADYSTNAAKVYAYYNSAVIDRTNDTRFPYIGNETHFNVSSELFSCWGYDNKIYFSHNYKMLYVYLALGVPGTALLLLLILALCCTESGGNGFVTGILALPFIVLFGILFGIYKLIKKIVKPCLVFCPNKGNKSNEHEEEYNQVNDNGSCAHSSGSSSESESSLELRSHSFKKENEVLNSPDSDYNPSPQVAVPDDLLPPPPSYDEVMLAPSERSAHFSGPHCDAPSYRDVITP